MSVLPKPIATKVVDQYGGEFPQAVVYVLKRSRLLQETDVAKDTASPYESEVELHGFTYEAVYFYSQALLNHPDINARPLEIKEDGKFTTVLTVDMDNPQIDQILNANITDEEKKVKIVEADIRFRYK